MRRSIWRSYLSSFILLTYMYHYDVQFEIFQRSVRPPQCTQTASSGICSRSSISCLQRVIAKMISLERQNDLSGNGVVTFTSSSSFTSRTNIHFTPCKQKSNLLSVLWQYGPSRAPLRFSQWLAHDRSSRSTCSRDLSIYSELYTFPSTLHLLPTTDWNLRLAQRQKCKMSISTSSQWNRAVLAAGTAQSLWNFHNMNCAWQLLN